MSKRLDYFRLAVPFFLMVSGYFVVADYWKGNKEKFGGKSADSLFGGLRVVGGFGRGSLSASVRQRGRCETWAKKTGLGLN